MTRKILLVGNWKMNLNVSQASLFVHRLQERTRIHRDIEVVLAPTVTALANLTAREVSEVVITYEPVWAIGTGDPEKPSDIQEAVSYIRHQVAALYGEKVSKHMRVLYGASVEPEFVAGILGLDGVDG